jgi:hypothetical protein
MQSQKRAFYFQDENTTLSGSRELDQPTCTVRYLRDAIYTISFTGASYPPNILFRLAKAQHERFAPRSRLEEQQGMAAGLYAPYPTKTSAISFEDCNLLAT